MINRAVSIITKATSEDGTPPIDDHSLVTNITPCQNPSLFFSLSITSLGIIFGDIGTSPLYVVNSIFDYQPQNLNALVLLV
jgi:hypothetical protein